MSALADFLENFVMRDGLAEHEPPPHCNAVMLNAKTVESERQSKLPLILGGVGWNGVEWVWRGYQMVTITASTAPLTSRYSSGKIISTEGKTQINMMGETVASTWNQCHTKAVWIPLISALLHDPLALIVKLGLIFT